MRIIRIALLYCLFLISVLIRFYLNELNPTGVLRLLNNILDEFSLNPGKLDELKSYITIIEKLLNGEEVTYNKDKVYLYDIQSFMNFDFSEISKLHNKIVLPFHNFSLAKNRVIRDN